MGKIRDVVSAFIEEHFLPAQCVGHERNSQVKDHHGVKSPYVGIHVRRSDKIGTEAEYHGIEEYMSWVSEFFDK